MFRRSALPAAASLAVVLLAVTGCKIQVSGAAPPDSALINGTTSSLRIYSEEMGDRTSARRTSPAPPSTRTASSG